MEEEGQWRRKSIGDERTVADGHLPGAARGVLRMDRVLNRCEGTAVLSQFKRRCQQGPHGITAEVLLTTRPPDGGT